VTTASVVVPARDAGAVIDGQLEALAAQTYDGDWELIVVDNGSSDDTVARVLRWSDRIAGLQVVRAAGRRGPAHARNVGIAAASSDLVLVCDADDRVTPGWIAALVEALTRHDAVAGAIAGSGSGSGAPSGFGFGFLPAFATCSAAFHKRAWNAVGGFDESLPTCEDLDLAWRIQLAGFTLGQCPEAIVHYRGAATAGDEFRTWFRYGRYQPRLLARFRADGLRPEPLARVVAKWAQLVVTAYRLAGSDSARRTWCREAGRRCGRVVGSIRERAVYL
jgi:glycosyltransferase involved in cell wall biosynthesis